ncbi:hypothetical protein [Streptomyces apricus]|uniref:Uncharacterized protein n=1 Tax=Streptomyces apricus TaxID=1828112 RepID=A0A5B0AQV3_9ACTN|nr:hypothetical protein [Streptomyces apricus]KAA0931686.1 hypothetical protein FGF04_22570 [Streptomyces apricus]
MGTGGTSWRGAAPGPVLVTGVLVGLLAACGGSGAPGGTTGASWPDSGPPASSPAAAATPPEDLCARLVAHWARRALDDGTYGDYQSMGLSNGQYEILTDVVDAARTERERKGAGAAERLIDRTARARCEERYRDGNPSEGPWS